MGVPEELLMNYENALASSIGAKLDGLKPWLAVALLLIHEKSLGAQSKWAPYIALLPEELDLPLFWYDSRAYSSVCSY